MIGTTEIVLLAAVALLLFGGKKLPQMMRNMGKGVKEFQEGVRGAPQDFQAGMDDGRIETSQTESPNPESSQDSTKITETNEQ